MMMMMRDFSPYIFATNENTFSMLTLIELSKLCVHLYICIDFACTKYKLMHIMTSAEYYPKTPMYRKWDDIWVLSLRPSETTEEEYQTTKK